MYLVDPRIITDPHVWCIWGGLQKGLTTFKGSFKLINSF